MEFMEPPVDKRRARSTEWQRIVDELRTHPNEWARVGNFSPGVATAIRRGRYKAFLTGMPEHENPETYVTRCWQVRSAKTDDGTRNDIFVRWIGD